MKIRTPSYRLHRPSGQAVVTLNGRDRYLGKHGSPESRDEYDRVIGEWLASGRNRPQASTAPPPDAICVSELLMAYWHHAQAHYRAPDGTPSEELGNIKAAFRPLRALYGRTTARDFGPLALRAVRDRMVAEGLMRTTINNRVARIRRAFRWAASVELVPVAVVQSLETVAGLRAGRTEALEPDPVGPVPIGDVEKTLAHLSRPVAGLVRLQLLTGMRPGEAGRGRPAP
jgi:integrase